MQKQDLVDKNPLKILAQTKEGKPVSKRMGLVTARAGLGKTAILVQIALDSILRDNQVLHVSIGQRLEKTKAWYDDIIKDITEGVKLANTAELMADVLKNRLIMTFKESEFTRPKLEERLNDLVYQNIFRPSCLVIDGYDFGDSSREALADFRELMEAMDLQIWFSAVSHRDDDRVSEAGVPAPCHTLDDLFDTVVVIKPETAKPNLSLNIVKDETGCVEKGKVLDLDPATYLVKST
ncbi:MAG: hypothetical protein KKG47_05250 [Proteobacteria bacterium]|nr:hypothetical protein [Pseudomonadota bacterium]MBU1736883.1 hypothetical protein [Pseudomonadota bacterium]